MRATTAKKLNIFFLFFALSLCVCSLGAYASDAFRYDDRSDYLVYSSRTAVVSDVGYNGTASRLSRGSSVSFTFYGSDLSITALSYTNSGRARIYIDGSSVGYTPAGVTASYAPILAYETSTLSPGKHEVLLEAWDSTVVSPSATSVTAYFYVDSVQVSNSLDVVDSYWTIALLFLFSLCLISALSFVVQYVLFRIYRNK